MGKGGRVYFRQLGLKEREREDSDADIRSSRGSDSDSRMRRANDTNKPESMRLGELVVAEIRGGGGMGIEQIRQRRIGSGSSRDGFRGVDRLLSPVGYLCLCLGPPRRRATGDG